MASETKRFLVLSPSLKSLERRQPVRFGPGAVPTLDLYWSYQCLDYLLCTVGAQDLNFLTGAHPSQDHHLAVALANNVPEEDRVGCPLEELLSPDNAYNKGFCCCPPANGYSFVIAYDTKSKTFNQLAKNKKAFQEFYGGSPSVRYNNLRSKWPSVETSPNGPVSVYTNPATVEDVRMNVKGHFGVTSSLFTVIKVTKEVISNAAGAFPSLGQ